MEPELPRQLVQQHMAKSEASNMSVQFMAVYSEICKPEMASLNYRKFKLNATFEL